MKRVLALMQQKCHGKNLFFGRNSGRISVARNLQNLKNEEI